MEAPHDPHYDPELARGAVGRVTGVVRAVNRWLHYVGGVTLVVLMMVTVVDIVGRTFFNRPFGGTLELTEMAMILIVYLGFGYAEHEGDHISVDLVYAQVRPVLQLVLTVFNAVFGLAVIGLMTWHLYQFAGRLEGGGYTTSVLKIPQGPMALIAVAGGIMFVLALATTALLAVRGLAKERS